MYKIYEILVPTMQGSDPIELSRHREWDRMVRGISGGLTIFPVGKGIWVNEEGQVFEERMIPVRIMCTVEQMIKIVEMTYKFYEQEAIMYYRISNDVGIYKGEWSEVDGDRIS